jgi:hypothetical protein
VTQSYTPDTPTSIPPATCGYDVAVRQLPGVDQLLYIEADSFRDVAWRVRQRLGSGEPIRTCADDRYVKGHLRTPGTKAGRRSGLSTH